MNAQPEFIMYWKGQRVDQMTREELIAMARDQAALREEDRLMRERHIRGLAKLAAMRD